MHPKDDMKKIWRGYVFLVVLLLAQPWGLARGAEPGGGTAAVPILVYHRFGSTVADSMTVTTPVFAAHLEYLRGHGYTVIPLRQLTDHMAGEAPPPPARSVVITADDGHASVFTDMFPLVSRYRIPLTLFIYPSAISNAKYALTWQQLREMRDSGLVDIQSHAYWHPNFRKEKQRLSADAYEEFVRMQLGKSKEVLEQRLGGRVDMLAWPFGLYDDELVDRARQLGYVAGFTLERRPAGHTGNLMALPRYLMVDEVQGASFGRLLAGAARLRPDMKGKP